MKIITKLKLVILAVTLLPLFTAVMAANPALSSDKEFNQVIVLGLGVAFIISFMGPSLVKGWIVTDSLQRIKEFCAQVKLGRYDGFSHLPNEAQDSTDENEFVSLMRDMNWMAHEFKVREYQLEESIAELDAAQAELMIQKQALEQANIHLTEMAMTDPLTRLSNRRHFFDHVERELCRRQRSNAPIALFIIDIDHFKKINDCYGHQTGDMVLVEMANVFQSRLRRSDLVARIGGEEFAVLLSGTNTEDALAVALEVHQAIQDHIFQDYEGGVLQVKCSIGVFSDERQTSTQAELLYRYADRALYAAKNSGRNRVFSYDIKTGVQHIEQKRLGNKTETAV